MNKLYLLIILHLVLQLSCTYAEWQDPHDMKFTSNTKKLKKSTSTNVNEKNSESIHSKSSTSESQNLSSIYMKRFVGLLLQYPQLDTLNDRYEASIKLSLSKENYDFLQQFVKLQQISSENLRKVDAILEEQLRKSYFDSSQLLTLFDRLCFSIFNKTTLILGAMAFSIFLVYKCYCQQSPFLFLLKYIFLAVLVVEYYVVYLELLDEAENQSYINAKYCDTWEDFARSIFGHNKCKKIKVTPLQVVQKIFHTIFDTTLGAMGSGIGKYYQNIIQDVPTIFRWFLGPVVFLSSLFLLIVMFTFIMHRQLNINLFHVIQFHVGKSSNESNDRSQRGRSVQMERPLIQAVRNKFSPKKIEYTDKNKNKNFPNNESVKSCKQEIEKHITNESTNVKCDIQNEESINTSSEPREKENICKENTESKCDIQSKKETISSETNKEKVHEAGTKIT